MVTICFSVTVPLSSNSWLYEWAVSEGSNCVFDKPCPFGVFGVNTSLQVTPVHARRIIAIQFRLTVAAARSTAFPLSTPISLWYFKHQISIIRIYICLESGTHKHNSFKNKQRNNLTILSEFLYKNIFFNTMSIGPLRGSKLL